MIIGRVQRQNCDFDGYYNLLGEVIKAAIADAQVARKQATDLDSDTEFAEDWLRMFVAGSRYERSIIKLAGLDGEVPCRRHHEFREKLIERGIAPLL